MITYLPGEFVTVCGLLRVKYFPSFFYGAIDPETSSISSNGSVGGGGGGIAGVGDGGGGGGVGGGIIRRRSRRPSEGVRKASGGE